ncbi:MAG TPA: phosphoglucosamine mutase [Actinomycetota bacterium]|nr:phosphoglucosamine mutase [Actinomycetota bacterium]
MPRLFGTDGVRGVANRDLTPDLALALGRAAGRVLAPRGATVVVGRDTRLSGPMLEGALLAGLCSAGARVALAGVVPTPAVAFLTLDLGAGAGAVISASHNPVPDNGIKFFSDEGLKIPGDVEDAVESAMESDVELPVGDAVGRAEPVPDAHDRYVAHLLGAVDGPLTGLRVVLDCAFGAAWHVGPRAFREAGADVVVINAEPDGARINVECGSTSLVALARRVVDAGADVGFGFDGDADRVLAVDERGQEVDGDGLIAMSALHLHERGALHNELVVTTVMANLGLVRALEARGIEVVSAPVGDKYVAEAMAERGAVLGGEQSGHVIFARHTTTGDGVLTALKIAEMLASSGVRLSDLASCYERFPQVLVNVPVARGRRLDDAAAVWDDVRRAEDALGDDGRVLLRASGTEPVVRVMVEAADAAAARRTAESLADAVRAEMGA